MKNLAVVLPNWIGDAVMATPTLRAIRQRYPEAKIIGVMRPLISQVLEGVDWFDEIVYYDRRSKNPLYHRRPALGRLRRARLDAMVLLPNSLRAAMFAWQSGARRRIGYARDGRHFLLTDKLRPSRYWRGGWAPVSAVDYYLRLSSALVRAFPEVRNDAVYDGQDSCEREKPPRTMELSTTPQDERGAERVWKNLHLHRFSKVAVLNPGSAGSPARRWPMEHYVGVARRIVTTGSDGVLVLCGPGEQQLARRIVEQANHPHVQSMADQNLSIGVSKAVIRRSQLMITGDTGPRHIAHAFNTPVIVLSGPIDPRWSRTYNPHTITLQHKVPCGPCGKAICPVAGHPCLRDLTVDRVWAAVEHQWRTADRRAA